MKTLNYNEDFILCISFSKSEAERKSEFLKGKGIDFTTKQNPVAPALIDFLIEVSGLQKFNPINDALLS